MVESTETASWLPLGSALVIDWKHLGRPAPQRGATAWVAHLDGEPVILRAWGEDTTSYFDFAFLADERLAGTIIVACSRAEPGRLRVKTAVEVEGFLTYADTCEFKEHPRTMLLTPQNRALETKQGVLPQNGPPRIEAQAAEIFEIAPDGALVTRCGHWVAQILRMARDLVQGREAQSVVPRAKAAAPAPEPVRAPVAAPAAPAEPARRPAAPIAAPSAVEARRDAVSAAPTSQPDVAPIAAPTPVAVAAPKPAAKVRDAVPAKLVVDTNFGESFEIGGDQTFIGRSKQCAIVLKSQRVSRKHACVTREADGYFINDVGAANGIWQGSEKIDRKQIEEGDEYIVGDVVLKFSYA